MSHQMPPDAANLFAQGTLRRGWDHLGGRLDAEGADFAVWAPHARAVSVIGDFNYWEPASHPLIGSDSGVWTGRVDGASKSQTYKFAILGADGNLHEKSDPYALSVELPPKAASVLWHLDYEWADDDWMATRGDRNIRSAPISVYEVHLGSWRRGPNGDSLSYTELADDLVDYVSGLGFTHVEFMPLTEHPYYPSWGYQTVSYFAPTGRYGTPQELMYLIDRLHQAEVGVILDWVPSHFATDGHGLGWFDGMALYEHPDPRKGWQPDWNSAVFDYGRPEVRSFLISSANFWLSEYHIDGIRVDAVASMLYLDYSREDGEWLPNRYGGKEHLEAIDFLRDLNKALYTSHPGIMTIAEESTSWAGVSQPTEDGGLGFGFKWDMGWMHDTLAYLARDSVHRKFHQNQLTFRMLYAHSENFVLPLSHDEVVHGKGSLLRKMSGDEWQRFANLRSLFGYMYGSVGKKMLFMGAELAQWEEWVHDASISWDSLDNPLHSGMQRWVGDLNRLYRREHALFERDASPEGFSWVSADDADAGVFAWERYDNHGSPILVMAHLTPIERDGYRIGVDRPGKWTVLLNSNAATYGGNGTGPPPVLETEEIATHNRPLSLSIDLPPLSVLFLRPE